MPIAAPRYTVDQVRGFPDDGQRYELLDGVLLVTPSPRPLHQLIAMSLGTQLHIALTTTGLAKVVLTGDVEIGERTLLIPDILVYPARYQADTTWKLIREWWLAVEILSPSSRVYDREFKRQAYQAIGVQETWIVDPLAQMVEIWDREASTARVERERIQWRGVTIDLGAVWEGGR
ncbi:MAG: Uma2 family endonuclease [Gemmatimonadota bacterium]